jgi:hypothetical protein
MIYECEFDRIWKETVVVFQGYDIDIYLEGPRKTGKGAILSDDPAETQNTYIQNAYTGRERKTNPLDSSS